MTRLYENPPREISHRAHRAHKLKLVTLTGAPFTCDGCKEPGDGPRYTCDPGACSSFHLHTCCALAKEEETLEHHLYPDRTFKFLNQTPAAAGAQRCDACGDAVRGFVYHSPSPYREADCSRNLHPCCASLQARFTLQGHTFELRGEAPHRCDMCDDSGRFRRFWSYHDGNHVYLHLACMKERARRSWEEAYQNRVGGGGFILQASKPIVEGVLNSLPDRKRNKTGFQQFCKIVGTVVQIIIAVIFGDPLAMIAAVAGSIGYFQG